MDKNGHYCGIGIPETYISVNSSDFGMLVTSVGPGTPAERAKLQPGDVIVGVRDGDRSDASWNKIDPFANPIRGQADTTIDLKVRNPQGALREIDGVVRSGIDIVQTPEGNKLLPSAQGCDVPISSLGDGLTPRTPNALGNGTRHLG